METALCFQTTLVDYPPPKPSIGRRERLAVIATEDKGI
jgi:hypothetical protein